MHNGGVPSTVTSYIFSTRERTSAASDTRSDVYKYGRSSSLGSCSGCELLLKRVEILLSLGHPPGSDVPSGLVSEDCVTRTRGRIAFCYADGEERRKANRNCEVLCFTKVTKLRDLEVSDLHPSLHLPSAQVSRRLRRIETVGARPARLSKMIDSS